MTEWKFKMTLRAWLIREKGMNTEELVNLPDHEFDKLKDEYLEYLQEEVNS